MTRAEAAAWEVFSHPDPDGVTLTVDRIEVEPEQSGLFIELRSENSGVSLDTLLLLAQALRTRAIQVWPDGGASELSELKIAVLGIPRDLFQPDPGGG